MHLLLAGDCVLLAESADELRLVMEELQRESRKTDLKIIKWMHNEFAKKTPTLAEGKEVEEAEEYIYLGHLVNRNYISHDESEPSEQVGLQSIAE